MGGGAGTVTGMPSAHFRAGVVIVVRHPTTHQVMAFERADTPDTWQLPQGGLRDGELPLHAAWRELVRNHIAFTPPLLLDARMKPWMPKVVEPDPETVALVDRRWRDYFPRVLS